MKKILIVDDDPDILEVLKLTFEMEGFETKTTADGEKLFNEVEAFVPDIILLDIMLSGSDGRILCRKLKGMAPWKDIPVILISAYPNAIKDFAATQANDFIPKPFDSDELISTVHKHLTH